MTLSPKFRAAATDVVDNESVSIEYRAGQIVTVFRSRLRPDADPRYSEHAAQMSALAPTMPGYVEHKSFTAEDGERVTLVTFADRASHDAWRTHAEHRLAQRRGKEAFYEAYSLQVADVTDVSSSGGSFGGGGGI